MKKYLIFLLIILSIADAQIPKIDLSFRETKSKAMEQHYALYKKAMDEKTDNQEKYDITYYDITLSVNTRYEKIYGDVKVLGRVIADSLDRVELNLWTGMSVSKIYTASSELQFTHSNDILTVLLGSNFMQDKDFSFNVVYEGEPEDNPYGYFKFDAVNGMEMIYTLNEPYGARGWFPCKDVPSDKADSVDLHITVPTEFVVASNGLLMDKSDHLNSSTYWWHESYPIATYLISLAIHPYMQFSDWYVYDDNDSMEVQYYVFPGNLSGRILDYSKTVDMIAFYSDVFGQYPFVEEKYGHAEFLWGGGMEHQTLTSLGGASEYLIVHELAHQWWGDAVTCDSFHDLWLNEGFASYGEALWFEHEYAEQGYTASDYQQASKYFGSGSIYIENLDGSESFFSKSLRYDKASWVLHMLRGVVGDDKFFEILQTYFESNKFKYASATTEDFNQICNDVSGINLDKFFQQWIYGEYYPKYIYSWQSEDIAGGNKITLTINQEQTNTGLFWMPIDVMISTLQKDTIITVWDSLETQQFDFVFDHQVKLIAIDPDEWILKEVEYNDSSAKEEKVAETFHLFQNFPNPFNPTTTISFYLPEYAYTEIAIYNSRGQKVTDAFTGELRSGMHRIGFERNNLASGVYFYQLIVNDELIDQKKMILLK